MGVHRVTGEGYDLGVPLGKLGNELCNLAQLSGAHGREVRGVREQHAPAARESGQAAQKGVLAS